MMRRACSTWHKFIDRARRDERGISAVEFALVLPVMFTIYLGVVELSKGYMASQRMTVVARTLADLLAQQQQLQTGGTTYCPTGVAPPCVNDTLMSTVFGASAAIMAPYDQAKLTMTVSQIIVTNKADPTKSDCVGGCQAKTDWTIAKNGGTARPCVILSPGNAAPVSVGTIATGYTTSPSRPGNIIIADVTYSYTPPFGSFEIWNWKASKTFNMSQTQYMITRGTTPIAYKATTGTKCS
jgi:Flp pilus assembly protein TadG